MANFSEAYDFELFEERSSAAPKVVEQPQEQPQRQPQRRRRENVVEMPQKGTQRQAKRKRHPLRFVMATVCFIAIFVTVIVVVQSQVLLTELTQEINTASDNLAKAESVEIQLSMQAALRMNDAQVEQYAVGTLGMSKISGTQVTYINVARADQGQVVQDINGGSPLDKLWAFFRGLFV